MRYFYQAIFELVICTGIGFKLLEIKSIWGPADTVAYRIMIAILVATFLFLVFSLRFICCRQSSLINKGKQVKKIQQKCLIEEVLRRDHEFLFEEDNDYR